MGFTALNRIAKVLRWEVDPDPSPKGLIDLTFEEFAEAVAMLATRRVPDGADRRGGLARLPGLAGQLRDGRLPAVRPADRTAGTVVGHSSPSPFGIRRSPATAAAGAGILAEHRPQVVIPPSSHRRGSSAPLG